MKEALVYVVIGVIEGFILNDWLRDKRLLRVGKTDIKRAVLKK